MRIWDLPTKKLCRKHLLGEHSELHAIWSIITKGKRGYAHHPEVIRWRGKLRALYFKHEEIVCEMIRRGYNHDSPLNITLATGEDKQDEYVDSLDKQRFILKNKGCDCEI